MGFPGGTSGKEPTCQFRKHKTLGFDPWVGKIPWRRAQQPTPVFWPGESHRQRSLTGMKFTNCSSFLKSFLKKLFWIKSVQFSCSVVSDSLRPHELQHARPPCPSPTLKIHVDKQFFVYAKKSLGKFTVNTGLLLSSFHISNTITILDGLY